MALTPAAQGARCALHAQTGAVDICQRCGSFVCGECLELQGSDVFCTSCFARAGGGGKASSRAVAALVLGILGIQCGLIPGIVGLVLATQELAAIEAGQSPAAGKGMATGGKILGWISVVLLGLVAVIATVVIIAAAAR